MSAPEACEVCKFQRNYRCHRFPPQVIKQVNSQEHDSVFPVVRRYEWCGEFVDKYGEVNCKPKEG
jgi:hypothetical protein